MFITSFIQTCTFLFIQIFAGEDDLMASLMMLNEQSNVKVVKNPDSECEIDRYRRMDLLLNKNPFISWEANKPSFRRRLALREVILPLR